MLLHRIVRLVAARNVIFLFFFVLLAVLLIYLWLRVRTGAVPGLSMNVFDLSFLSPPRAPRPRAVPGLPWDPKFCGLPYLEADWLTGLPYLEEYLEDRPDSPPLLLYWRLSPREVAGLISLSCCLELGGGQSAPKLRGLLEQLGPLLLKLRAQRMRLPLMLHLRAVELVSE